MNLILGNYLFKIDAKNYRVFLINCPKKSDINYTTPSGNYILYYFSEIEEYMPYSSLRKYPFKEALERYKKLEIFI